MLEKLLQEEKQEIFLQSNHNQIYIFDSFFHSIRIFSPIFHR